MAPYDELDDEPRRIIGQCITGVLALGIFVVLFGGWACARPLWVSP